MSIKAYRVKKIDYKQDASFNLWHDRDLVKFLENKGFHNLLNNNGDGITEISVEVLEEALKEVKIDEYVKKQIEEDVKTAKERGDEDILYYCF